MAGLHLTIEGGGTRSTWVLSDGDIVVDRLESQALQATRLKTSALSTEEQAMIDLCEAITIYAAGLSSAWAQARVADYLDTTKDVIYKSDVDAAVHAYREIDQGIIALLGTGSYAVYKSGDDVSRGRPSLGWAIHDEGSGVDIGRRVLRAYADGSMPGAVRMWLTTQYDMDRESILAGLYGQAGTTAAYLASYGPVPAQCPDAAWGMHLAGEALATFVECQILPLQAYATDVYTIGSIGYYYQDVLDQVLSRHGYRLCESRRSAL